MRGGKGAFIAARSWTGVVDALADARVEGSTLVIDRIRTIEGSALGMFGAEPQTFEWFLRCHALREKLPLPVDEDGATLLESAPLTAFSVFGTVVFYASKSWRPPPPTRPLGSDDRIIRMIRAGKLDDIERAVAAGEDVDAPAAMDGYSALHIAALRGDAKLAERLLALGADPNRRADKGVFALGIAVAEKAPPQVCAALQRAGVDMTASNDVVSTRSMPPARSVTCGRCVGWSWRAGIRWNHAPSAATRRFKSRVRSFTSTRRRS